MANRPFRPAMFSRMRFKPEKGTLVVQSWDRVQVYRATPPQAWVKGPDGGGWRHNRGDERLLSVASAIRRVRRYHRAQRRAIALGNPGQRPFNLESECMARFVELLEPRFRRQLYTLRSRSWQMYSMLYRCDGAVELSRSNHGLAFCLANHWAFTLKRPTQAMRTIRRLLPKRRREIAEALGFPRRELSVRILGRIRGRDLELGRMLGLRDALQDKKVARALSHLPALNEGVLDVLTEKDVARQCAASFLEQLSTEGDHSSRWIAHQAMLAVAYAQLVGEQVPRFTGIDQVGRVLAKVEGLLSERRPPVDRALPPPPIPGIPGLIEPIDSTLGVYDEGISQDNCLATARFRLACMRGDQYIYRVFGLQRCTLALRRAPRANTAGWVLYDFKAANNRLPGEAASASVREWLTEAGIPFFDPQAEVLEVPDDFEVAFDDAAIPF